MTRSTEPAEEPISYGQAQPSLSEAVQAWAPNELFWITRNGLKMTGMPAFGPTHDDRTIWAIVAFLQKLPELSPQAYRQLVEEAGLLGAGEAGAHRHGEGGRHRQGADAGHRNGAEGHGHGTAAHSHHH